jgi:hypothetical protein
MLPELGLSGSHALHEQSIYSTRKAPLMFYQKNLPVWERILRVLAGAIVIAVALFLPLAVWVRGVVVVSAVAFAFFGFIGFCPMCAMVGRKLDKKN